MKKLKVFIMLAFSTVTYSAGSMSNKGDKKSSEPDITKLEDIEEEEKVKIADKVNEMDQTDADHISIEPFEKAEESKNGLKNISKMKKAPAKERGIDRMNFYIPVKENNRFTTFGEFDYHSNKNIYQWTLGEGYLNINDSWDFNYRIEREYHVGKKGANSKSYVWDNEISFVRLNKGFKIGNQSVSSRSILGVKHSETDTKLLKGNTDYKFYVGQRLSAFFGNVGMGGTYGEVELSLNGVKGSMRNGYSVLTSLKSNSTLGYGFQWSNTFENEYMDYNNYKGAIRSKVESLFRWTYELGRNWAFSPEISVKGEKYFSINEKNYTFEAVVAPYIMYSQNVTDKFRVYAKAGPAYRVEKSRYGEASESRFKFAGYAKLGIEYIF